MTKCFAVRVTRTRTDTVTVYVQVGSDDTALGAMASMKDEALDLGQKFAREKCSSDRFEDEYTEYEFVDARAIDYRVDMDVKA